MNWVLVVEDSPGEAVLRRLLKDLSSPFAVELVDNCGGYGRMRSRLDRYRNASKVYPHVLLTDLDQYACPLKLMSDWKVTSAPPRLLFRIAVREVEAWLMGDRAGLSKWLQVPIQRVPEFPETELDPKAAMLRMGRSSKSRRFRLEFCPAPGSAASQGPLYNELITTFAREHWNLALARSAVPSLERACQMLERATAELSEE